MNVYGVGVGPLVGGIGVGAGVWEKVVVVALPYDGKTLATALSNGTNSQINTAAAAIMTNVKIMRGHVQQLLAMMMMMEGVTEGNTVGGIYFRYPQSNDK